MHAQARAHTHALRAEKSAAEQDTAGLRAGWLESNRQAAGICTTVARQEWVVWGSGRCWTALCICVPLCLCDGCPLAHAPSEERASSMSLPLAGAWGCSGTPCAAGSFGPAGETRLLMGRGGRPHAGARHLLKNCGFRGVAGCVSTQWRGACVCAGMPSRPKRLPRSLSRPLSHG